MAGRISDRDIAAIRERARIDEVVGDYVQLRRAGADSLKGLCPFHDEKSPSFHVRPNHGHFHCFGCGEGGDVYAFIQKIEHVTLRRGRRDCSPTGSATPLTYKGGGHQRAARPRQPQPAHRGQRRRGRVLRRGAGVRRGRTGPPVPHRSATSTPRPPRHFGCGFAPAGWDTLTKHLLRKGFEFKELEAAGLSREGTPRPDGPLPPPAAVADPRRSAGEVIGFGARRLFDDDRDRGQVRQHPRDAALQEVEGAVRPRPGQARHRQGTPGGRRRGLHRRDGDAPGRA